MKTHQKTFKTNIKSTNLIKNVKKTQKNHEISKKNGSFFQKKTEKKVDKKSTEVQKYDAKTMKKHEKTRKKHKLALQNEKSGKKSENNMKKRWKMSFLTYRDRNRRKNVPKMGGSKKNPLHLYLNLKGFII